MSATPQQPSQNSPTLPTPTPTPQTAPPKQSLRQKLTELVRKRGLAAILAYGLMEILTYTFAFIIMYSVWKRGGGVKLNKEAWMVIAPGMWAINNFTRPIRIGGAVLLAGWVDRLVVMPLRGAWRRWGWRSGGGGVGKKEENL